MLLSSMQLFPKSFLILLSKAVQCQLDSNPLIQHLMGMHKVGMQLSDGGLRLALVAVNL